MSQANRTHFHSSDSRFCGSKQMGRPFTMDPNLVTCRDCQRQDRLYLSAEAQEYLDSLRQSENK